MRRRNAMEDEDFEPSLAKTGAPAWMVTFADLSTLLLVFFVLLLSFSEMDVAKFKELAGSMREAFGVQAEIETRQIPKGTSLVAQEFSPGQPKPTVLNEVRQFTIDSNKNTLEVANQQDVADLKDRLRLEAQARADAARISAALAEEIAQGKVVVRALGVRTVVHIMEKGSFALGSADIKEDFAPVLQKIHDLLLETEGVIRVAGHTDNLPIATTRFRSNWELSSARAVSVLHALLRSRRLEPSRFVVAGYADTKPIATNDNSLDRSKNRRVDISIVRGDDYSRFDDSEI